MHPLLPIGVFWLLPLVLTLEEDSLAPRRSVPYHRENARLFQDDGVFNYTTMLLREDLDLLVLGAREAVYALDLKDISKRVASVKWEVTQEQKDECQNKGKDVKTECLNYIRVLDRTEDKMYVCGTNAFDPECDYMSYADGKLTLEKKGEDGKGKCPFDPFQRYATIMDENNLYSATSLNFLGSEPILMRSSPGSPDPLVTIRTEFKNSWLHEPTFVSMAQMPESDASDEGDDDKVYLFFSETAVECDCYSKLTVSRVARVCKGDLGGQRTLQNKWTSFLKARLDCPVLESQLPYVIQDTYRWCDPQQHWRKCLFYAVFTPQSGPSDVSAVCAYRVSDISRVFAEGQYKTAVPVETSFVKWVMYSGDIPVPRPGACIDNEARKMGITQTLDLPDQTLQFIRDRPLMDQAIQPVGGKPLLVRSGATFTCIVVNEVQATDGEKHHVMFIGTEEGTVLKAVNYDGEMFIIEEVQLFQSPEPIKVLKFSNITGQLYAGSDSGAAQMPLASCGRSSSCLDCVLARDPHCGWDIGAGRCTALSDTQRELIQSVKARDASGCPGEDPVKTVSQNIWPGGNLKLLCPLPSNLAETSWVRDGGPLAPSPRLQLLPDGLLILNASDSEVGRYRCVSVELRYSTTVAEYEVSVSSAAPGPGGPVPGPQARRDGPSVAGLQAAVGLLLVSLLALLAWNFCKGHLPLPWNCRSRETHLQERSSVPATDNGSSPTDGGVGFSTAESRAHTSLQFIDEESDI